MSPMPYFSRHLIRITEPGTRTVHGSVVPDWDPQKVTSRTIERCLVEPRTTEDSPDPDTTADTWKVLIPGHQQPPTPLAKIVHPFSTSEYQIIGEVLTQPDTRGGIDHYFLALEKWKTNG